MVSKLVILALAALAVVTATPVSRIAAGQEVSIQEFPYAVSIIYYYHRPSIYIQRCAGSLISSWHLITGAYCFRDAVLENVFARIGSANSMYGGILATVVDFIPNPGYEQEPRKNDIAVLYIDTPVYPGEGVIETLYLPPQNWPIPDGQSVEVYGWGFIAEDGPQSPYLLKLETKTLSLEECKEIYEDDEEFAIKDTVLCVRSEKEDAGVCTGDVGAPMVLSAMTNVIVGVSSLYKDCGNNTYPDVFTRVDRYTDWIVEVATAPSFSRSAGVATPRVAPRF